MHHRAKILAAAALAALSLICLVPRAGANVVGSDAQNFNPIPSGLDFVTVQSSETLEPGVFNLGLFVNHAKNTFPYYYQMADAAEGYGERRERDNSLLGGDFNLAVGLARNWDVGLSFPFILHQVVEEDASVGRYSSTGNTEIRPYTKLRLFGSQRQGQALVASGNFNRIANNPYVGSGGGPILNAELAADTTIANVALALNLGYRWRNPGNSIEGSGIEPIPNQYIGSAAFSLLVEPLDTKVIFEVLGAIPEKEKLKGATDREYSVLEALAGLKHDRSSGFSLHLGAGAGLLKGVSSPDFRVYTGLNWAFGFGSQQSVQTDPYAENRKRVARVVRRKPPTEEIAFVGPRQQTVAEEMLSVLKSPAVTGEPKASVSVEKVRELPVFNRGSYNHLVLNTIEFMPNSKELKPESERYIKQELTSALRELHHRRPIGALVVEGHTDSVGDEAYNLALSEKRAEIVANVLRQSLGFSLQIQSIGFGETSPIADNGNFQGRALNRRVEFKLLYQRSAK